MKTEWAAAVLAAALLTGCAGMTTGVSASGQGDAFASGARGYGFARTAAQADDAAYRQIETLVQGELARRGFDAQPLADARYRLSIAYATQPGALEASAEQCGGAQAACVAVDGPAPALAFVGKVYRHVLTLRFVDAKTGGDVYQVSASLRDRQPDARQAAPALVRGALAKLPFDAGGWLVKTKKDDAGGMPGVVSVKPADAR
ncbi:protein of unknown function DUF4136 [Burkholderia sp. lig30]|jgi:hypothetical protein|uniref:DUF4136 domain-containing protein n=1 Tax=Burkholderia sp. lig30 TaxID=1192124 RepID=UPI0004610317|nr:DUF4136 domain-containing protein [Burkholderia sp. lig30]KDB07305.1 protein of unknown function DUF4136 [Burkholderia sp. lig30]